jgi:hypothetical protein
MLTVAIIILCALTFGLIPACAITMHTGIILDLEDEQNEQD